MPPIHPHPLPAPLPATAAKASGTESAIADPDDVMTLLADWLERKVDSTGLSSERPHLAEAIRLFTQTVRNRLLARKGEPVVGQ